MRWRHLFSKPSSTSPPVQPGLVSRPRLVEQLDEGLRLGHKLTLISAPAGYGKTTLVSGWVHQNDLRAAWVSLDEGDNDPSRFWAPGEQSVVDLWRGYQHRWPVEPGIRFRKQYLYWTVPRFQASACYRPVPGRAPG